MNVANFYADRERLYAGGMVWWIEHEPVEARRWSELKAREPHKKAPHHKQRAKDDDRATARA